MAAPVIATPGIRPYLHFSRSTILVKIPFYEIFHHFGIFRIGYEYIEQAGLANGKQYTGGLKRLFLSGCTGIPENITAVQGFDVNRYLAGFNLTTSNAHISIETY